MTTTEDRQAADRIMIANGTRVHCSLKNANYPSRSMTYDYKSRTVAVNVGELYSWWCEGGQETLEKTYNCGRKTIQRIADAIGASGRVVPVIHIRKEFVTRVPVTRITPSWVSNGHWCLKRELVRNLADLQSLPDTKWREYEDSTIEDFIARPANRAEHAYEFTGLAKVRSDGKSDLLRYCNPTNSRSAREDKYAYLDRDYINMARARGKGIDTAILFSRNGETFYSKCKQFIVQAVRQ